MCPNRAIAAKLRFYTQPSVVALARTLCFAVRTHPNLFGLEKVTECVDERLERMLWIPALVNPKGLVLPCRVPLKIGLLVNFVRVSDASIAPIIRVVGVCVSNTFWNICRLVRGWDGIVLTC